MSTPKLAERVDVPARPRMRVYFGAEQIEAGLAELKREGWPSTAGDSYVAVAAEALAFQMRGGEVEFVKK